MSGVTHAWSSTSQQVRDDWAAYRAAAKARHDANVALQNELRAGLADWLNERNAELVLIVAGGHRTPFGIEVKGTKDIPPLWRRVSRGQLVPHRGSRAGKELHIRLKAGPDRVRFKLAGMPSDHFTGTSLTSPGSFEWDDTMWVGWGVPEQRVDELADRIDQTIWTPRRLSEWHAAHEALEDSEQGAVPA